MIFEYVGKESFVHRLDPRTKIIWLFVVTIFAIALRQPLLLVLLFASSVIPFLFIKVPKKQVIALIFLYMLITAGAIISQALFYRPLTGLPEEYTWIIPPDFPVIGPFTGGILISMEGAIYGFIQAFRILAILNASAMMVMTTPLNRLIVGMRKMGIPSTLAFMLSTAVRFVPTLMDEYQTIFTAQNARGILNKWHPLQLIEYTFTPLVLNSVRRCNQLALAAESRGFDSGCIRTSYVSIAFSYRDVIAFIVMGAISTGLTVSLFHYWGLI